VTKRELALKSLVYRVWTMTWESALASILLWLGMANIFLFIVLVNAIKIAIYFGFDLGWFSFTRRPGWLKRVRRWLGLE